MYGDNVTFSEAAVVCLFSMVVVFLVLLSISYMIDLVAWFVNKGSKKAAPAGKQETPVVPVPEPVPQGADLAEVAAITAAVAVYLGKNTNEFIVRSIRKVNTEETAWSCSSRLDSLQ